jgi:putative ABC transport system permease protein
MLLAKSKGQIEGMPGVKACTRMTWFGGIYQDERNFFPQFACDAGSVFHVLTEAQIEPRQLETFIQKRTACVVGQKTMERFHWRVGQKITLLGAMWPCNPELEIAGSFRGGVDDSSLYFHHEYFNDLIGGPEITGLFWLRAESPELVPGLIERIDAQFANTDTETITETEHAFQIGFVSLLGNIKVLIGAICAVIVFTLVLVTGGTMSIAIRERTKEIAILKALGFASRHIFGLIVAEAFGLAMAGGCIGALAAWAGLHAVDLYNVSRGMFVHFEIGPQVLARTLAAAGLLGVLSCVFPAFFGIRRSVTDGLRMVD